VANSDVLIERQKVEGGGDKLVVIFNRPEKINSLTRAMIDDLNRALDDAEKEPDIRVVLLYAAGTKGFCAGLDRAEMNNYAGSNEQSRALVAYMYATAKRMDVFKKPVITLVQGHCVGAGTQIAMAADLVIAGYGAKISEPEFRMGGFADDEWLRRIGHVLGPMRAKTYVLLTQVLNGQEAAALGMVSMAVPDDELVAKGHEIADNLAKHPLEKMERTLRLIDEGATGTWRAEKLRG
jgi:enoyl-CoA hydratase/carnithine racemase